MITKLYQVFNRSLLFN